LSNIIKVNITYFLNNHNKLPKGTGWWKFEICYGKHVIQFHEDESSKQRVSTVLLGTWNVDTHLEYMQKFPHKKPAKNERS
jgi:endoplasmic reticulum lectin 1